MDKSDLQLALTAEAESLDKTAAEYEKLLGGTGQVVTVRATAAILFRGMAAVKRAAAAVLA